MRTAGYAATLLALVSLAAGFLDLPVSFIQSASAGTINLLEDDFSYRCSRMH